jgi:hypothetical protein
MKLTLFFLWCILLLVSPGVAVLVLVSIVPIALIAFLCIAFSSILLG